MPRAGALREYGWAAAVVAVASVLATSARAVLHVPDVEMLFLLGVTVVAVTSRRGPSIAAAALSVLAYDFFFVPPAFTLDVDDARYGLTFVMMLGIGVLISSLTFRLREQRRAASEREERTAALYTVARDLGSAAEPADIAGACANAAHRVLGVPVVMLRPGDGDVLVPLAAAPAATTLDQGEVRAATWAFLHGSAAGPGTSSAIDAGALCLPLRPLVEVVAVLVVRVHPEAPPSPEQREFLDALCGHVAVALERVRLAREAREAALRAEAEELRGSLLSAVSHDLRTPLAAITGAATALRDDRTLDVATRGELVEAICDEAERLERLVRNLLDMTRLDSGAVQPRREWIPVDELVGGALTRVERQLGDRRVTTSFGDDLPLVAVDPVLVEQLLVNVLENAAKYTPPDSAIDVAAVRDGADVAVEVADRGPGLPAGAEQRIFERFQRGEGAAGVAGAGLGLAIARAIAQAHGAALTARARPGGGAVFRLTIPAGAQPSSRGIAEAAR